MLTDQDVSTVVGDDRDGAEESGQALLEHGPSPATRKVSQTFRTALQGPAGPSGSWSLLHLLPVLAAAVILLLVAATIGVWPRLQAQVVQLRAASARSAAASQPHPPSGSGGTNQATGTGSQTGATSPGPAAPVAPAGPVPAGIPASSGGQVAGAPAAPAQAPPPAPSWHEAASTSMNGAWHSNSQGGATTGSGPSWWIDGRTPGASFEWDMGSPRTGSAGARVWIPTQNAGAEVEYTVYVNGAVAGAGDQVTQQLSSGWHNLPATYDLGSTPSTMSIVMTYVQAYPGDPSCGSSGCYLMGAAQAQFWW